MARKLGMDTAHRMAIIKNQASNLLWYGKIKTTASKAKEVRPYVEKLITVAVNSYEDIIESTVKTTDAKGKEISKKVVKDGTKKLNARRKLMSSLCDLQEVRGEHEKLADFKARIKDINHPLIEKIFNEIAPKYAERAKELGQGGGYTRIYLLGERRGDAAQEAIIELV